MNDIIYNLLLAVITALGVAFVRYALPWLKKQAEKAEMDLREKNYTFAAEIVASLVYAVEQTVSGRGQGEIKYETVTSIAKQAFADVNIQITDTQLETLIESTVHAMNAESQKAGAVDSKVNNSDR